MIKVFQGISITQRTRSPADQLLSMMRDKSTPTTLFRQLLEEIALLMGYEITRNLPMTTWRSKRHSPKWMRRSLKGKKIAIVPILRAGLGMADGLMELLPAARMGHIGLIVTTIQSAPSITM